MSIIKIQFDLTGLSQLNAAIEQAVDKAVERLAIQTGKNWAEAIYAADIPKDQQHEYARTLKVERAGPAHFVVSADYDKAHQIENGRPARDLKQMLQTSQKTRRFKNGKKYLVIPFRQNTPGEGALAQDMSAAAYKKAKFLSPSAVSSIGSRLSATGATVPQSAYIWGGRLPAGLTPKLKPGHATDIHAGMVKMRDGKSDKAAGYLTFRVMSEGQTGKWLVPVKPGLHIAEGVANRMQMKAGAYVEALVASMLS
ncbi:MAG: hypothetical protein Q8O38_16640 [Sulfurimicrobium sp.]|nr:hypothetical protein [Sulfurimicrobium sp.]